MKSLLRPVALAALALAAGLSAQAQSDQRKTYIVQLKGEPAATYQGTVSGYAATQPAPGTSFQANSGPVQAYFGYIAGQQDNVLSRVPAAEVVARYNTVFNGFAVRLTEVEAINLLGQADVVNIVEDQPRKLDTVSTPRFLGLDQTGGLWSRTVNGSAVKGENTVIAVIDSGIWPESPAFADRVDGAGVPTHDRSATQVYAPLAGWNGSCLAGEGFDPTINCNNKLIGARYYTAGRAAAGVTLHWSDFNSARDSAGNVHGGHGTHTSSTAAGNYGATAIVAGVPMGTATGIAPRARVATYKVCWTYVDSSDPVNGRNGCFPSDSLSAIEDAIKDGANVINYSISGATTTVNDVVEQAFYRAALAGVFVAASAGNSGPANTVNHPSPWLTTVAASSHDRSPTANLDLGNGARYLGASLNVSPLGSAPLIRAEQAGLPGADPTQLSLCYASPQVLDPAKVAGKVVICTRGQNARTDKSLAVAQAGGAGMVLVDNGGGLVADVHSVPSVHVSAADGAAIQAYAAADQPTAAIGRFYNATRPAPIMAGFSSRGPNMADANLLKPDLTAPGVDIIASVSAPLTQASHDAIAAGTAAGEPAWASYQGTSMSSPHVAGLALLLRQSHPSWSPAAIKSALMTTAYGTLDDGLTGASNGRLPWSQGAGHVAPQAADDPGLVYDAGKADYVRYQCKVNKSGVTPASDCTTYGTLDETYNLNQPSITVANLLGTATVTRSVTNVGATAATYTATASLAGFNAVVTPATLTLNPGETKSFTVKLSNASAPVNQWGFGSLSWTDGSRTVTIPVQAKPSLPIQAPAGFTANQASGSRVFNIKTGYSGKVIAKRGGLKEVSMEPTVTLAPGQLNRAALLAACQAGADTANVKVHTMSVPANTVVARFALRQADVSGAGDDFDLMLLAPDGSSLYSGGDTSDEAVQIASPAAGSYRVCVTAYAGADQMSYSLSSWIVGQGQSSGGSFAALTPGQVYANSSASVGMSWSGLTAGKRYLGGVQLADPSGTVQATTVLRVETNGGLPVTEAPASVASKINPLGQ